MQTVKPIGQTLKGQVFVSKGIKNQSYCLGSLRVLLQCLEREWPPVFDGDKDAFVDDGYSGA
ncbi:unnamed protein product, partial [marine sediment metagenome]